MPSSSSRLTSEASVKRAGGDVVWPLASSSGDGQGLADGEHGQQRLAVVERGVGIVGALDVGPEVAGEGDGAAGGGELGVAAVGGRGADAHLDRLAPGVDHLRGDGALPDQLVEAELVAAAARRTADSGVRNDSPAGRMASWASCAFLTLRS